MASKFSNVNHRWFFFIFPTDIKHLPSLDERWKTTKTHREKHPWAFLNNKKYYINDRLLERFKTSKILLDNLRTKTNYKYAIHFSNTFSLNVPLCTVSLLLEGGRALINPAQWINHCSITKVAYTITLYMGKCLRFFYRRKTSPI